MAARSRRKKRRRATLSHEIPDLEAMSGLHFQARRRIDEILEHVATLRSAGRTREVEALLKQAKAIRESLRVLEAEGRTTTGHPR